MFRRILTPQWIDDPLCRSVDNDPPIVDFGSLDALSSGPDATQQRTSALHMLALKQAEFFLDIGCGLGHLCCDAAPIVGSAGAAIGIDFCNESVRYAQLNFTTGPAFLVADARTMPFRNLAFDAIACVQMAEYLPDVQTFLGSVRALLKPGGRALFVSTDWESMIWASDAPDRMAAIKTAWKGHCRDPDLPRNLGSYLTKADFDLKDVRVFPIINFDFAPTLHSFGLAGTILDFLGFRRHVTHGIDLEAWHEELVQLGREGRYFFRINRFLHLAAKPM